MVVIMRLYKQHQLGSQHLSLLSAMSNMFLFCYCIFLQNFSHPSLFLYSYLYLLVCVYNLSVRGQSLLGSGTL